MEIMENNFANSRNGGVKEKKIVKRLRKVRKIPELTV